MHEDKDENRVSSRGTSHTGVGFCTSSTQQQQQQQQQKKEEKKKQTRNGWHSCWVTICASCSYVSMTGPHDDTTYLFNVQPPGLDPSGISVLLSASIGRGRTSVLDGASSIEGVCMLPVRPWPPYFLSGFMRC
ncbi:hypothetical protein LY76DRAFT_160214 [Colletotrichum caudatum]|nr:hypothetical protein LY76DRAFT_160214 [Colletotrichum caudatum]